MSVFMDVWFALIMNDDYKETLGALRECAKLWDVGRLHFLVLTNGADAKAVEKVSELAQELGNLHVLNSHKNGRGSNFIKGAKYALKRARASSVVVMLGGPKVSASYLGSAISMLESDRLDGVFLNRLHGKSSSIKTGEKMFASFYRMFVELLFGVKCSDVQSPAKFLKVGALDKVFDNLTIRDYGFDINLIYEMHLQKMSFSELNVAINDDMTHKDFGYYFIVDTVIDTLWYRLYKTEFYKSLTARMKGF